MGQGVPHLFGIRGGACIFHGFGCQLGRYIGAGGKVVGVMIIPLPEVLHKFSCSLGVPVRGPHGGYVHIICCRACNFHQFRRHETVVSQYRLVHAQVSHFLEDEPSFLIVACHHHGIRIGIVDFGELGGKVRVLIGKGFCGHDFHALLFQCLFEGLVSGHLVFIVVGIKHGHSLITQELMGFLNSLGNIFRFRHAVPEHIVPYIHKPFRRGGHTQKGNLRLLEEGPHRLVFTGNQRSHHDHLFSGNEFLGRRHRLLHIALGVHHFHIHVDFSFFVDFIHRHVKAFFFRQAVGSHAAGNAVDKAYLSGLSAALSFSLSAAAGKSCTCSCHHKAKACQFESFFPVHHFHFSFG